MECDGSRVFFVQEAFAGDGIVTQAKGGVGGTQWVSDSTVSKGTCPAAARRGAVERVAAGAAAHGVQ